MTTVAPPIQPPPFTAPPPPPVDVKVTSTTVRPRRTLWQKVQDRFIVWKQQTSSDTISFSTSLCFHVIIILILALMTTVLPVPTRALLWVENEGDFALDSVDFGIVEGVDSANLDQGESTEDKRLESIVDWDSKRAVPTLEQPDTSSIGQNVFQTISAQSLIPIDVGSAGTPGASVTASGHSGMFATASLEGRSSENRRKYGMLNGATKESEAAVDAALVWFAAHQSVDGSWSTEMTDKPCNGRCTHGTEEIGSPKRIAATGLALLCFLGAGHTHRKGDYQPEVYKAIQFLTRSMKRGAKFPARDQGRFLDDGAPHEMYEQGIAVLALCEVCQMTGDTALTGVVSDGIQFIERSQHADGSWGYLPNTSGDLSIVGWQLMALKSAQHLGMKVRPEVILRADKFLDSQQSEYGAFYGYRSTKKDPCMTAIGLLIRLYRGWPRTDPRIQQGAEYILDLGPSTNGVYYDYYATHFLFQLKHPRFKEWNSMCRDHFVQEQSQVGHEKGSWYFGRSHFNQVGGRLYCTAMATLTLEVYYRLMPINTEVESDAFAL